jgi:hypothetical protein
MFTVTGTRNHDEHLAVPSGSYREAVPTSHGAESRVGKACGSTTATPTAPGWRRAGGRAGDILRRRREKIQRADALQPGWR